MNSDVLTSLLTRGGIGAFGAFDLELGREGLDVVSDRRCGVDDEVVLGLALLREAGWAFRAVGGAPSCFDIPRWSSLDGGGAKFVLALPPRRALAAGQDMMCMLVSSRSYLNKLGIQRFMYVVNTAS